MPTLQEIENQIDQYLYLPDKGIIKLLCAFALTIKLPIPPLWLFISCGSSTGKTELLTLLEKVEGWYALDNMTENTLLSGMKRFDASASLLNRLPENGFIVFKDFTTMLSKNKEALGAIMGQLRVVYDGSYKKETGGQVESNPWKGKLSLLAAGTGSIYSKTEEFNEMGTRSVVFKLTEVDDYEVGAFAFNHQHDDRGTQKQQLQDTVRDYINQFKVPKTYADLPTITKEIWNDLTDIAHLASTARSPVERERYGPSRRQTMIHQKEGMMRLFGQIKAAAYGLMLQNEGHQLTNTDRKLLYQIGLDCIDPRRRSVLQSLTRFAYGGDTHQIGDMTGYSKETTDIFVEDLFAHKMLEKHRNNGKTIYTLKEKYREVMSRFENIVPEEKALPQSEEEKTVNDGYMPSPETILEAAQVGIDI